MEIKVNVFSPGKPHPKQAEVLNALDSGDRFVLLRAGRKWRKTSLMVSWLFEKAFQTGLSCPYVAPSKVQAKNIVWDDHIQRLLDEFTKKKIPFRTNEVELSVSLPGGGKVQLFGVENKEALRGISNWGAIACDEYDDWQEDIWPLIIRPNLIPNKSPAIIGGTPKGFRNLYRLEEKGIFKCFHFTSHDNPELSQSELVELEAEYKQMGESYYRQEILAEYMKPYGVVYEEWPLTNYVSCPYDPALPLHLSFDFGVNDPTAIVWIQRYGGEFRVIDYYETSDGDVGHFVQVINSKPYKQPELVTGDPAGKARSITSNTTPIDEYARHGINIRVTDGVRIPDQIRATHKYIPSLFVNKDNPSTARFRELLLNYKYPEKKESLVNQSNEIPIHDEFSHGMRALEYYFVNVNQVSSPLDTYQTQHHNIVSASRWGIS
jgi:phage terminase large subunit